MVNAGKYGIHGSYGSSIEMNILLTNKGPAVAGFVKLPMMFVWGLEAFEVTDMWSFCCTAGTVFFLRLGNCCRSELVGGCFFIRFTLVFFCGIGKKLVVGIILHNCTTLNIIMICDVCFFSDIANRVSLV